MARVGFGRAAVCLLVGCVGLAAGCGDDGVGAPGSVVEPAVESDVGRHIDALFARFHVERALPSRAEPAVSVSLPSTADDAFELRDRASGLSVRVALAGARPVQRTGDGARAFFAAAAEHGGDVVLRSHAHGVEDFVLFEREPSEETVRYRIDVATVAGLRLVDDVLELQSADGAPRLRMERPWIADTLGSRARARVSVEDCAHAVDSRPFEPPSQAPGKRICTVKVSWNARASGLEYPLLLDPNWTATSNNMSVPRKTVTATALVSGKVLIVGGIAQTGDSHASADLFDPTTTTFAAAKPMAQSRYGHAAARVGSGASEKVVVTGGVSKVGTTQTNLKTTEIYDVTTDSWSAGADMAFPRYSHAMAAYPQNGQLLVTGGYQVINGAPQSSAELWNGSTWAAADPMSNARIAHKALAVKSSEIWVIGGYAGGSTGTVDKYTGTTRSTGPSLVNAHDNFAADVMPNGTVLVHTGNGVGISAEYWDGLKWNVIPQSWRRNHGAFTLPDGTALVAGHQITALRFDPAKLTFYPAGAMNKARFFMAGSILPGSRVLMAGGSDPSSSTTYQDAEVFSLTANGQQCASNGECASLKCVEGICCNSDCTGVCQSCLSTLTGVTNGTCASIKVGTDPYNDCAADVQSSCGNDGMCDGAGACHKWPASTQCGTSCVNGTQSTLGCNGSGSCSVTLSTKSCGGQPCANAQVCSTTCSSSNPCQPGFWCDAGTCKAKLAKGAACTISDQCGTGYCADSICCDQACTGLCQSCKAAGKGYGADGDCNFVKDGTDAESECNVDTGNACGNDGTCDGAGACRKHPSGTTCGTAACQNATTAASSACNGLGVCISNPAGMPCEPYRCDSTNGKCKTTCTVLADCASGNYCELGLCVPTKIFGVPCTAATECLSGFCVDGVCCDSQCGGQCEACAETGNLGKCVTVSGAPRGNRAACNGTGTCKGSCDGTDKNACSYPGNATACGAAASCTGDTSLPQGTCDGTGSCTTPGSKNCLPYGCDSSSGNCHTTCASNADCAQGATCDTSTFKCAITGTKCKDAFTIQLPNGQIQSCAPYKCVVDACAEDCKASTDCAPGYACSGSMCVESDAGAPDGGGGAAGSGGGGTAGSATGGAAGADSGADDGGCGCRVAPERGTRAAWGLALGLLALARRRRATARSTER